MTRRQQLERIAIGIGFGAAFALMVAVGMVALLRLQSALSAGDLYVHSWEVLRQSELVMRHLTDAETGHRGYLLTGETAYLEPYNSARAALPREVSALRELVSDNPDQQQRVGKLESQIVPKLDEMNVTIELRRQGRLDAANAIVASDKGRHLMDEIRATIAAFQTGENQLRDERELQRDLERRQTFFFIAAGSIISLLILGASLFALLGYNRRLRATERGRRESDERLSVTLASIGDAVIATDVDGRVAFMNEVAQRTTGWNAVEAKGRPLDEVFKIINEESRKTVEHPVEKVLRTGRIVGLANHTVLVRRDGSEIPIDDSAAPIRDGANDIMGVVLVFRDVSERKDAQITRERYLQIEAANQAKDQFLAMLSHELRSPLNAMLGWVRLLQKSPSEPKIFDRAVEVLDRNIALQTKLINELLDLSRVISGKLRIELEPAELAPLVHDCADSVRPATEAKRIALEVDVAATPLVVNADAERLQQVIANLLDNAVKFTPAGGRIELSLRRSDDSAVITVRDNGEGIPASFLPHVFERFRQSDGGLSRTHGGLGIGLAIVQHLVTRHSGEVVAASDGPGTGAAFTVTLPLAQPLQAAAAAAPAAEAAPRSDLPASILIVEDDVYTLEALKIALSQGGTKVLAAHNVTEALALFEAQRPSVILSDISMPGGDGYSLIRTIRQRETEHTFAVAMTGLASNEDRNNALAAGFDAYFTKPVDPEHLLAYFRSGVR